MRRVRRWINDHKALSAVLALAGVGLAVFLLYWFAPWKLFIDNKVDEAPPRVVAAPTAAPGAAPAPPRQPVVLSEGAFRSLEHTTTGTAKIVALGDGSRVLRFEGLKTSNGPDLIVILSPTPAIVDSWTAYGKGAIVQLGALKGNIGSQNYPIPPGVDLSRLKSAVIWCRRFTVAFGAASIEMGGAPLAPAAL
jgi:hypothetical protein